MNIMNRNMMTGLVTGSLIGATIGMYAVTQMNNGDRRRLMRQRNRMMKKASNVVKGMNMF
ncbi:hypothetical protein Amet_2456 [Alkaliphilus metalliredigens QYMF]|uniref:YtxH domain-containing protein n=2 Tax=Alkaliphilus TaxID=114627 RepID=A6TQZ2_ALKMQ|nr:hypothetical protein Amet_2456 [Alkaliphilus metalliredigens QYMF]